jgi:hypothetical protein
MQECVDEPFTPAFDMGLITRLFGRKDNSPGPVDGASAADAALSQEATQVLQQLLESHGVHCEQHQDWLIAEGRFPAIRARWFPKPHGGQLDIDVGLDASGTMLVESFAGIATKPGTNALHDAFHNFVLNSFHVLLAALWNRVDDQQVLQETWSVGGTNFTAWMGNVGTRSSSDAAVALPKPLMPALEAAVRAEPLSPTLHWFRFYFGQFRNDPTIEALQDNGQWPAGQQALRSLDWPTTDGFYSARLFVVLKPAAAG